jgi:hypothetical protein
MLQFTQDYAAARGVPDFLYGVELGNEATHGGKINDLGRYRRGFQSLRSLVQELWPDDGRDAASAAFRPQILGPSTAGSQAYADLVPIVGGSLDIVVYHV